MLEGGEEGVELGQRGAVGGFQIFYGGDANWEFALLGLLGDHRPKAFKLSFLFKGPGSLLDLPIKCPSSFV